MSEALLEQEELDAEQLQSRLAELAGDLQNEDWLRELARSDLIQEVQRELERCKGTAMDSGRALLAQDCSKDGEEADKFKACKKVFDLVGPRLLARLLSGQDACLLVLSGVDQENANIRATDLWGSHVEASLDRFYTRAEDSIEQMLGPPSRHGIPSLRGILPRLLDGLFEMHTSVELWCEDHWQRVKNVEHAFLLRSTSQLDLDCPRMELLRITNGDHYSHAVCIQTPGTFAQESELKALECFSQLLGITFPEHDSCPPVARCGEAFCRISGTQILAANEHLYFTAIDMLQKAEQCGKRLERVGLEGIKRMESKHRNSFRRIRRNSFTFCVDNIASTQATSTYASPTRPQFRDNLDSSPASPAQIMAPVLVTSYISQGMDAVHAKRREEALRHVWSDVAHRNLDEYTNSRRAIDRLQHTNKVLRTQRDDALHSLKDAKVQLHKVYDNINEGKEAFQIKEAECLRLTTQLQSARKDITALQRELDENLQKPKSADSSFVEGQPNSSNSHKTPTTPQHSNMGNLVVETNAQCSEPEVVSDEDEDSERNATTTQSEIQAVVKVSSSQTPLHSPLSGNSPRMQLEDALNALSAKYSTLSPKSPLWKDDYPVPQWMQAPQAIAPILNPTENYEVKQEDIMSASFEAPPQEPSYEALDSSSVESEKGSRSSKSKVSCHECKEVQKNSMEKLEVLNTEMSCLQSQLKLFQRSNQQQKGVILEQRRRIAIMQSQFQSFRTAVARFAEEHKQFSGVDPDCMDFSAFDDAIVLNSTQNFGASPSFYEHEFLPNEGISMNSIVVSPKHGHVASETSGYEEELAKVQQEHQEGMAFVEKNYKQQIQSLQSMMKKALRAAHERQKVANTSEETTAATRVQVLEEELEWARKQNIQLEDQLQTMHAQQCEHACSLDEKVAVLQAKDQLLHAYEAKIKLLRAAAPQLRHRLHIELMGKLLSRAQKAGNTAQLENQLHSVTHQLNSISESKDTVISGLRHQLESQAAATFDARRAKQDALVNVQVSKTTIESLRAELEKEQLAHAGTKSLLEDAEACIRSQIQSYRNNPSKSHSTSMAAYNSDCDSPISAALPSPPAQYSPTIVNVSKQRPTLHVQTLKLLPVVSELCTGRSRSPGASPQIFEITSEHLQEQRSAVSNTSSRTSASFAPAFEHIERLEEAFRSQRAQLRVLQKLADSSRVLVDHEVLRIRVVASAIHASREAMRRLHRMERNKLGIRICDLEEQIKHANFDLRQRMKESNLMEEKLQNMKDRLIYADSQEVRDAVSQIVKLRERLQFETDIFAQEEVKEGEALHSSLLEAQSQIQVLQLASERQRLKHDEALAEAAAEIEHHRSCRDNLQARCAALRPMSAFELFDSFKVPDDVEAAKRIRIERILEDLRVTLASLEPYLIRDV